MSSRPSCVSNGRPKTTGSAECGWAPSSNVLWSTQTLVDVHTETLSYAEFQLPTAVSVGSQTGKQSYASATVRFRTMTLCASRIRMLAPTICASSPTPTRVTFEPTCWSVVVAWIAAAAMRAFSSGPLGLTLPHGPAGS